MFLLSSGGFGVTLVSGEGSSGGTGSSDSEVIRGVSGLGKGVFSGSASHLTEDGEDLGDVFADGSDSAILTWGAEEILETLRAASSFYIVGKSVGGQYS